MTHARHDGYLNMERNIRIMKELPPSEKYALTITEACKYFGIGEHTLRRMVDENKDAGWLFRVGNRTMIKRNRFEHLIDNIDTV